MPIKKYTYINGLKDLFEYSCNEKLGGLEEGQSLFNAAKGKEVFIKREEFEAALVLKGIPARKRSEIWKDLQIIKVIRKHEFDSKKYLLDIDKVRKIVGDGD